MQYIHTEINVLYKYKCSYTFFLCTIDSSQQISDFFFYETLISMVDCHGEKQLYQCDSRNDKNTLYFGGLGQITDTITRF